MKAVKTVKAQKCLIGACDQPVQSKTGGMCPACQCWWRRVSLMNARDLTKYLRKLRRFGSRYKFFETAQDSKKKAA
jgi:hypothetical protein